MQGVYENRYEKSMISLSEVSNTELKSDALHILDNYNQDYLIVKYRGSENPVKIYKDGTERLMEVSLYDTSNRISYIINELSFSFVEKQTYDMPKSIDDFNIGMVVECLSGSKWIKRQVIDPKSEYDKIYKLLIKYDRVRIPN